MTDSKPIGELNGFWGFMFKLGLLCVPFVIALETWQVVQIITLREFKAQTISNRWTSQDQAKFVSMLMETISSQSTRISILEEKHRKD